MVNPSARSETTSGQNQSGQSSSETAKVYSTLTFVRGTLDVEDLLRRACSALNALAWRAEEAEEEAKNRFCIHYVPTRGNDNDEWGYGAANESILADLTVKGEAVKALVHFARNGFAYTVDRGTGRILVAEKYGPANWARGVDLTTGLPQVDPKFAVPPAPAGPATPGMGDGPTRSGVSRRGVRPARCRSRW